MKKRRGHMVISGDIYRRGQDHNINQLAAFVAPYLEQWKPRVMLTRPLPWLAWLERFDAGPYEINADILIGFELPPAAKRHPAWIDVRLHPLRFAGRFWSVRSNIPGVSDAVAAHEIKLEPPEAKNKIEGRGCFTCQVSWDASLVRGGKFIRPEDVIERIRAVAANYSDFLVIPHPVETENVWAKAILKYVPKSKLSPMLAYPTMARSHKLLTVTSSTGFEAPYFGCEAEFLSEPPEVSCPVRIDNRELWASIAESLDAV